MKEPEFDASSLEKPDVEPAENLEPAVTEETLTEDPTEDAPREGSSLEHEEFYVKKGSIARRPKYSVFGVLGGLVGLILGLVLAQVGAIAPEQNYTRTDLSIVLVGLGVPLGILAALGIALALDRRRK